MKDPREVKLRSVGNKADVKSRSSRWSVSAIVPLSDAVSLGNRSVGRHRQIAHPVAGRSLEARIDGDRVFVREGALVNAGGENAAIDFGLSLDDDDLGRQAAFHLAQRLVVLLKRPGDQSRFSVHLAAQVLGRNRINKIQQYILNNPEADLSIDALAKIAAMSPRNFSGVFKRELGLSPSDYVDLTRIDVARYLLEGSRLQIGSIAAKSGFGSARAMRRAFRAHVGVTPSEYRACFRSSAD